MGGPGTNMEGPGTNMEVEFTHGSWSSDFMVFRTKGAMPSTLAHIDFRTVPCGRRSRTTRPTLHLSQHQGVRVVLFEPRWRCISLGVYRSL